jgi:hypothetical protein
METSIVCPNCKKTMSGNAIIAEAAKGEGSDTQSVTCECGEKISYWQVTAQLRDQKTVSYRFQKWIRALLHIQS